MSAVSFSNAPFYFMLGVPLAGVLVSVVLCVLLCRRIDRIVPQPGTRQEK
jgi:hypothetical protein